MNNFMWLPIFGGVESVLKIFAYMTVIVVGIKLVKALNIYINKNSR